MRNFLREHDEDSNIELKSEISDKDKQVLEPVVGFANGLGGVLILGVHPKSKDILGISEDKDTINNWITDLVKPQLSTAYQMTTIPLKDKKFIYLLQIKSSPVLHAAKIKDYYVYYVRKGSSTRQLTPEELNRLAHIKEQYRANEDFRRRLVNCVDDTLEEISSDLAVSDVTSLVNQAGTLSTAIRKAKSKSINVNVLSEILDFYENLAYSERTCPHLRLSNEEEKCLATMREHFYFKVWEDRSIDLSKIETWRSSIDTKLRIKFDESFQTDISFVHELYEILEPLGQKKLLDEDAALTLRSMFFSYDNSMNDVLAFLSKLSSSASDRFQKGVLQDSLERMNNQIRRYSNNLIAIVKDLVELKDSVETALNLIG